MASKPIQIEGYEILRLLGSGGMSSVYLALQRSLDRKVAIKVMRRSGDGATADNLQAEKRFLLEGRMMAKLPHRNIVAVYDIVSNDDIDYIAMEYLPGGVLVDRMREGIALADAVSVIVQVAAALEFAHEHGVVHRDLKPANIMFRDASTPVLTDFGIARFQDGTATRLTQTGMLVGTPTYMSPEQINGQQVDGRADQYSLGILFYELLAGNAPFRGDSPIAVLMAHLTQEAAPLPPEFHAFQDVFDRMLAKNRDDRYPNLKEFSNDLKSRLVNSDTLLLQLQLDPNQTASEQLRELGFYTGNSTDSALRANLAASGLGDPMVGAAATAPRTPPPSVRAAMPAKPARKLGLLPAIVAGMIVLLLVFGAWWIFGRNHLSRDAQELVNLWNNRATELIAAKQFVVAAPGSDGSALDFVHKIQSKDPDNARARQLQDEIDSGIAAQVQTALDAGQFDEAQRIDTQGLQALPQAKKLLALKARIAQARIAAQNAAMTDAQKAAARATQLQRINTLVESQAATDWSTALTEVAQLLASNPDDEQARALRVRIYDAFAKQLQGATDIADFDAVAALLKSHEQELSADPAYTELVHGEPGWREKLVAAAQAQVAAAKGVLVLNATPWAVVESVTDGDGHAVSLPTDASTPLLLSAPPGSYVVVFRQPLSRQSRKVSVSVESKKRASANVGFGTISAQEYFSSARD
ncbi:MAG TPA: protein kinase [Rudaea sp.]|nr:protein kinase [Rudaea sp.]